MVAAATVLFCLALPVTALGAEDAGCEAVTSTDLITAASRSDTRGVIEYEVIAENSFSIGKSVAASRRIWGEVTVERWIVTASRSRCPSTPTAGLGDRFYVMVGIDRSGEPQFVSPSAQIVSQLEAGALASMLGQPVDVGIGAIDTSMAWLRVMWWPILLLAVPLVLVGAVVRRRRAGARRDYLF